jgi:hypothetical protein
VLTVSEFRRRRRARRWVAFMRETRAWNLERLGVPPNTAGLDRACEHAGACVRACWGLDDA